MLGSKNKVGVAAAPKSSKAVSSRSSAFNVGETSAEEAFNLKAEINLLKTDLERRQETYIARERAYKQRIDELEEEFNRQKNGKTSWMKTDTKMGSLKHMQHQIVENVELVQDRTAHVLQEQERDLLRAFRARLFDVQTELEKEKGKKDDGAGAWIEKSRQLEAEVEWAKQVADRLERVNQGLVSENSRLKSQSGSQEMDRNNLIKELCAYKKDNSILRAEYVALESESEGLRDQVVTGSGSVLCLLFLISIYFLLVEETAGGTEFRRPRGHGADEPAGLRLTVGQRGEVFPLGAGNLFACDVVVCTGRGRRIRGCVACWRRSGRH